MNNDMSGAPEGALSYELRKLDASDVFQMLRVLRKIGIKDFTSAITPETARALQYKKPMKRGKKKDELVEIPREEWTENMIRAEAEHEAAFSRVIIQIIDMVLDKLPECEGELVTLLANGIGEDGEAVRKMPALQFVQLISDYVDREEFADFFMQAFQLLSTGMQRNLSTLYTAVTQTPVES